MILSRTTYYDTTKKMNLQNYIYYLETQDKKYFSSNLKENKECQQAYMDFFNDFLIVSENREVIDKFVKLHQIEKLRGKHTICSLLIYSIRNYEPRIGKKNIDELVDQLVKWGYKIKKENPLFAEIDNIENRLNSILTKIKIIEAELSNEESKESISIEKQLNSIENIQEKKYRLKAKDLSVYDFLEMQKECKSIIEQRNKK